MSAMTKLSEKWELMDAKQKRNTVLLGGLVAIFLMATVGAKMKGTPERPIETKVESKLLTVETEKIDIESLVGRMASLEKSIRSIESRGDNLAGRIGERVDAALADSGDDLGELGGSGLNATGGTGEVGDRFESEQIRALKREIEQLKEAVISGPAPAQGQRGRADRSGLPSPVVGGGGISDARLPGDDDIEDIAIESPSTEPLVAAEKAGIRITGGKSASAIDAGDQAAGGEGAPPRQQSNVEIARNVVAGRSTGVAGKEEPSKIFLPATSILRGVLLSGVDAPTSSASQRDPTPVLIRLKHEALLPNFFKMDVKECHIIGSAFGTMSTERANIRTETITCVRRDGGIVEQKIDGYGVGEDGKQGMRGRVVQKRGQLIASSLVSGVFGGFAAAVKPQAITGITTNPGNTQGFQTPELSGLVASGAGQGLSSSLNEISKFYLDLAKEVFPVVEVDAGRTVEIVLIRGVELDIRRRDTRRRN